MLSATENVGKLEQHNDDDNDFFFFFFRGFVDIYPLKSVTYHPFNLEGKEGAESKDDPEDRTNDQSEPEDSGLRI